MRVHRADRRGRRRIGGRRQGVGEVGAEAARSSGRPWPVVERRVLVERRRRDVADAPAVEPSTMRSAALGDPPDHRGADLPLVADLEHAVDVLGLDDGEHALLGLAVMTSKGSMPGSRRVRHRHRSPCRRRHATRSPTLRTTGRRRRDPGCRRRASRRGARGTPR